MHKSSAIGLILLGGTCMSFVGLFMRLIENADGFQILGYRSLALAAIVLVVACLKRRRTPLAFLAQLDRDDVAMGLTLSLAFASYVFAMLWTSVASTLFILTSAPFLAAVIGWLWIGETPRRLAWISMAGAALGVGLMIGDGLSLGRNAGNLMALLSAFLFALMLVIARHSGKPDVLGGTFLGGVFAALIAWIAMITLGNGIFVSSYDLALSLFMGAFTIGIGIAFVTWGTPFVPAAEVSLLVLIESVLGPLWVWLFLSEAMTRIELLGGAIVLAAVTLMVLTSGKRTGNVNEVTRVNERL